MAHSEKGALGKGHDSFCSGVLSILADTSFGHNAFGVGLLGQAWNGTVDSSHWIKCLFNLL